MLPEPIQILRVAGSHREVGRGIGEAFADAIREAVAREVDPGSGGSLPAGRTLEDQLTTAARYRAATERVYPWLIEELDGCAEGAGVDPLTFFAVSIEEIWYEPATREPIGRCSDLVAGPAATTDGHLLVGHNNDLGPEAEEQIVAIVRESEQPGVTVIEVAKKHRITQTTLSRWGRKFSGLEPNQAAELQKTLKENTRLKKMVAERDLEIEILKEINAKKW